jgi:hypothetical protein
MWAADILLPLFISPSFLFSFHPSHSHFLSSYFALCFCVFSSIRVRHFVLHCLHTPDYAPPRHLAAVHCFEMGTASFTRLDDDNDDDNLHLKIASASAPLRDVFFAIAHLVLLPDARDFFGATSLEMGDRLLKGDANFVSQPPPLE